MQTTISKDDIAKSKNAKKEFDDLIKNLALPQGAKVGALLLHGLTGMPNEMRPLAQRLESLGCQVEAPMLPGHGSSHDEMLKNGWKDWVAGARESLNKLTQSCDQVVICGLSMGSLIGALLAIENEKVVGLVAMSPTIQYDGRNASWMHTLLPLIDIAPILGGVFWWTEEPPYGLKDERLQRIITRQIQRTKQGDKTEFGQFRTYAGSLRQLQLLVGQVKKQAANVTCPVLIMHSTEDSLTTIANPQIFYNWLGSTYKKLIFLDGCDHVLTLDLKKEEVCYNACSFVCRVVEAKVASTNS